jgi:hypothetical protein
MKGKITKFCKCICLNAIILFMFSLLAVFAHVQESSSNERELSRRDFPSEFLFGVASSAYQVPSTFNGEQAMPLIICFYHYKHMNKLAECIYVISLNQYEGGYLEDGNGLSNWDEFSHIQGVAIISIM